jgi:probable rRNA maturation factor
MAKKKLMKIQIENNQKRVPINNRRIRTTTINLLKYLNCTDKEISITFVDDLKISLLNKQYLGKVKPTNVLSFSLQEGEYAEINPNILGDIVISAETAQRDAAKGGLTLEEELIFLIIHGLLHLLGFNHEKTTKEETKIMRKKEKELFAILT